MNQIRTPLRVDGNRIVDADDKLVAVAVSALIALAIVTAVNSALSP